MKNLLLHIKQNKHPYLFIAPTIILLIMFSIIPIIVAFGISFTDIDLAGIADWSKINFINFDNYINLFKDPNFIKSIGNSIFFVVLGVPLVIISSLSVALLLNYGTNAVFKIFRAVYYTPAITNIVAVSVIWGFLYNSQYGLFNYVLSLMGMDKLQWLQDPFLAKVSLVILAVWKSIGINMLIFLAALKAIPKSYYEAAAVDGANRFRQFISITLPSLKFAIFFVSVTTLIGWIQFFEEPFVMTKGGPLGSTTSMALYIYQNGFQRSEFGFAAAGSFVLFVIIILVTILQFKLQKKQDEY